MKRALLSILLFSPLALAQSPAAPPMPPAMVAIPAPDLPEKRSLQEELNRTPAIPSSTRRRSGYTLDTQSGRAYLEPSHSDLHPDMLTPQWELFNWKTDTPR